MRWSQVNVSKEIRANGHLPSAINPASLFFFSRESSEIGYDRLRYGQGGCTRKERVGFIGADQLCQRAFRCARQLRYAINRNLAHCRLILPEALDGVPGHRKST